MDHPDLLVDWISGSSIGAICGALIAGSPRDRRIESLRKFWCVDTLPLWPFDGPFTHERNWTSAVQTRLFGRHGFFNPRLPSFRSRFSSFYDLAPLMRELKELVDFELLNSGETRLSVATTDVQTGELIIFDSTDVTIEIDHLLASCGFLPEFSPIEINGRLLGDGGLSANAPFEPILTGRRGTRFLLSIYSRETARGRRVWRPL